jgi:RimJ/RimL family protein N-acetyltransferase
MSNISSAREVGIFIFKGHQGRGIGKQAIELLEQESPGKLYANIAPSNQASIAFFEGLGFNHIQNTYLRDDH